MATDYLDPDEMFEMRYADEMSMTFDLDTDQQESVESRSVRRKLDFNNDEIAQHSEDCAKTCTNTADAECTASTFPVGSECSDDSSVRISGFQNEKSNKKRSHEEATHGIDYFELLDNVDVKKRRMIASTDEVDKYDTLIEKILLKRQEKCKQDVNFARHLLEEERSKLEAGSISANYPNWSFVTLRNRCGDRLYVKIKSEKSLKREVESVAEECKLSNLLEIPIEELREKATQLLIARAVREEEIRATTSDVEMPSAIDRSRLWVEKYAPSSYMALLSDENTNRTILHWLKLWDKVVFGIVTKKKIKKVAKEITKLDKWRKFPKKDEIKLDEELDEHGCPKYKIALLCGPPGLGKTTLAHLVAKHAGYNVVEINASDDRTPDFFRSQLEAATQMKSVMGHSPRPNLLVLDEIDGAPQASVDVLVKFAKGQDGSSVQSNKKKRSKLKGVLKRPVICICNDLYVPALRSLRQIAFVIHFPSTTVDRLAQRLVEIAQMEGIKTDIGAMIALCEKTNNDIRSCLSTLYCMKNEPITLSAIRKSKIGDKDMQKGLFTIWEDLFQIYEDRIYDSEPSCLESSSRTNLIMKKRAQYVLKTVQGNGDYEKLAQGVYENFLNVKIKNTTHAVAEGLNWFCFFDEIRTAINVTQNYSLYSYLSYPFVTWHLLFSNYARPKIAFPSFLYELSSREMRCQQLLQDVMQDMQPNIRIYTHRRNLLMDTLPLFMYIITPAIRPVSIHLYSPNEKEALNKVVKSMLDYNLNFIQIRLQDGGYDIIMNPNIEEVVKFSGQQSYKMLSYAMRQIVSREIELEKVTMAERRGVNKDDENAQPLSTKQNDVTACKDTPLDNVSKSAPNHLQKLTPKQLKTKNNSSGKKDFFGRIIAEDENTQKEKCKVDDIVKSDIWFHFKEGFSNAVRRPVYIKDLL